MAAQAMMLRIDSICVLRSLFFFHRTPGILARMAWHDMFIVCAPHWLSLHAEPVRGESAQPCRQLHPSLWTCTLQLRKRNTMTLSNSVAMQPLTFFPFSKNAPAFLTKNRNHP